MATATAVRSTHAQAGQNDNSVLAAPVRNLTPDILHLNDRDDVVAVIPVWDQDMDQPTQESVDRVLDYIIRHGVRPRIQATGDIISVATKIIQDMKTIIPASMADDLDSMLNHLMQWICDYAEHTNTKTIRIRFGFEAGQK